METRAHYVTVGVFVLVVLAAALGFVYWLYKAQDTSGYVPVDVVFSGSVTGLTPGASVFYNGLRIGSVTSLSFSTAGKPVVVARAMVDPNAPLRKDVRAELGYQGITGVANLSFSGGGADSPSLFAEPGIPRIQAGGSAIEELLNGARDTLKKTDLAVDAINNLIRENSPTVTSTIANIEKFSGALADNSDEIRNFLAQAGRVADVLQGVANDLGGILQQGRKLVAEVTPEDVRVVVANVRKFSDSLGTTGEQVNQVVAQVKQAATDLQAFTTGLNNTLENVNKIVAAVPTAEVRRIVENADKVVAGVAARAPEIDGTIADVRVTAANARSISDQLAGKREQIDNITADTQQMMARLNAASAKLAPLIDNVNSMVNSDGSKGLVAEATAAAHAIRVAADTVNDSLPGIMSNLGRFSSRGLPDLTETIAQLRQTLATVQSAVQSLERDPNRLIFGGSNQPVFQPQRR